MHKTVTDYVHTKLFKSVISTPVYTKQNHPGYILRAYGLKHVFHDGFYYLLTCDTSWVQWNLDTQKKGWVTIAKHEHPLILSRIENDTDAYYLGWDDGSMVKYLMQI